MTYYGAFYKSALYCLLTRINAYLLRWVHNKSIIQKSTIEWRVDDLSDGHLAVFT